MLYWEFDWIDWDETRWTETVSAKLTTQFQHFDGSTLDLYNVPGTAPCIERQWGPTRPTTYSALINRQCLEVIFFERPGPTDGEEGTHGEHGNFHSRRWRISAGEFGMDLDKRYCTLLSCYHDLRPIHPQSPLYPLSDHHDTHCTKRHMAYMVRFDR